MVESINMAKPATANSNIASIKFVRVTNGTSEFSKRYIPSVRADDIYSVQHHCPSRFETHISGDFTIPLSVSCKQEESTSVFLSSIQSMLSLKLPIDYSQKSNIF